MRRAAIAVVVLTILSAGVLAQQPPSQPSPQPAAPQPPAQQQPSVWLGQPAQAQTSVPPNQPVITIKGICPGLLSDAPAPGAACETQITREQFEKLVAAVNPSNQAITPEVRKQLGQGLAELLVWADAAIKAGIDKDPGFQDMMKVTRVRTLRDFYLRRLEEQARNVAPQDLQAFYNQNIARYQEIRLQRVFIPGSSPGGPGDTNFYQKAQALAATLQQRGAAGDDFAVLQKDAYSQLGITTTPPSVDAGVFRRGQVRPEEEKEITSLGAGQVSPVVTTTSGFVIYKVVSKTPQPLDSIKDLVTRDVVRSRLEAKAKDINATAKPELNDQYFGSAAPAPAPAPTLGPPR
jgi:parvulin-like peptidyl-prolyl isomerase